MKKCLFLIMAITAVLLSTCVSRANGPGVDSLGRISREAALEDFNYAAQKMRDSWPYIGVAKRKSNIDFEKVVSGYITKIKQGPKTIPINDFYDMLFDFTIVDLDQIAHTQIFSHEIFFAGRSILNDLNDRGELPPGYSTHIEALNNPTAIATYETLQRMGHVNWRIAAMAASTELTAHEEPTNIEFRFFKDDSAAYVKINSFANEYIDTDREKLLNFYANLSDYKNLIIDITYNGGGSALYPRHLIIEPNISQRLIENRLPFFLQNDEFTKNYAKEYGFELIEIAKFDFSPFPKFNQDDLAMLSFAALRPEPEVFNPTADAPLFNGKIYVLVSGNVYSASAIFTQTVKSTGFATIIGENTRGTEVIMSRYVILPHSGLLLRWDNLYGINSLGQNGDEFGIYPDIPTMEGKTALETALYVIRSGSY